MLIIINLILTILGMVLGAIKNQLDDPNAQWVKTTQLLILGAALLLGLIILVILSQAGTVQGQALVCSVVAPCQQLLSKVQ